MSRISEMGSCKGLAISISVSNNEETSVTEGFQIMKKHL